MMKNYKMIAFTLLFALFTVQFPEAHAAPKMHAVTKTQAATKKGNLPVYRDVISDINLGYHNAMLHGDIKLANGAVMHIIDYKTRHDQTMSKWHAGDVVVFTPHVQKEKLILAVNRVINGRVDNSVEPYVIFDSINSPKACLTISEIREKGKYIKLSDNSVWEFSFYNCYSTEEWSVGERVLVSGSGDKNSYTFINLDVPLKHNVYSATASFVVD